MNAPKLLAIQCQRRDTIAGRAHNPNMQGWRTLAYVEPAHADAELERQRARFGSHAPTLSFRAREKNPPHGHIPPRTVSLGTCLDLTTQFRNERTHWDFEVKDWHLLCDPGAMDAAPGRAALYLVRGEMKNEHDASTASELERITYERWHDHEPEHVSAELDVPDLVGVYLGRALRIGYRSAKWNGNRKTVDYDHDFTEGTHDAPECWADTADLTDARALIIVGGDMRITEAGID